MTKIAPLLSIYSFLLISSINCYDSRQMLYSYMLITINLQPLNSRCRFLQLVESFGTRFLAQKWKTPSTSSKTLFSKEKSITLPAINSWFLKGTFIFVRHSVTLMFISVSLEVYDGWYSTSQVGMNWWGQQFWMVNLMMGYLFKQEVLALYSFQKKSGRSGGEIIAFWLMKVTPSYYWRKVDSLLWKKCVRMEQQRCWLSREFKISLRSCQLPSYNAIMCFKIDSFRFSLLLLASLLGKKRQMTLQLMMARWGLLKLFPKYFLTKNQQRVWPYQSLASPFTSYTSTSSIMNSW